MKIAFASGLLLLLALSTAYAWDPGKADELHNKAQKAVAELMDKDPDMRRFFDNAAGYVVIPTVGKAGLGIGGARGKGLLYENGASTAIVTLTQLSIGFQAGGQAYSEYIFFKDDLIRFILNDNVANIHFERFKINVIEIVFFIVKNSPIFCGSGSLSGLREKGGHFFGSLGSTYGCVLSRYTCEKTEA